MYVDAANPMSLSSYHSDEESNDPISRSYYYAEGNMVEVVVCRGGGQLTLLPPELKPSALTLALPHFIRMHSRLLHPLIPLVPDNNDALHTCIPPHLSLSLSLSQCMVDQILNYAEAPFCRMFRDLDILLLQVYLHT